MVCSREGFMGVLGELRQYWLRQLAVVVLSLIVYAILLSIGREELESIPRDASEALFTASATLLGLTFTAFSILATFIPGLRKDFVKSHTFRTMGQTFVLAMIAEFLTLVLSGLDFLGDGIPDVAYAGLAAILFAILSVGFIAQLLSYMSKLFKMARQVG